MDLNEFENWLMELPLQTLTGELKENILENLTDVINTIELEKYNQ